MKDFKPFNVQVGNRLRTLRENIGSTQEEFAETLNVDPSHYRKVEQGQYGLTADKMLVLYQKYKIDPTYLITGDKGRQFDVECFLANSDKQEKELFLQRIFAYIEQLIP